MNLPKLKSKLFQSTLPRGSDPQLHRQRASLPDFNPRSLAGATFPVLSLPVSDVISIHAPLRERRERTTSKEKVSKNFNPRSLAGATDQMAQGLRLPGLFQSTLPCGSDINTNITYTDIRISIHAPSRERRQ